MDKKKMNKIAIYFKNKNPHFVEGFEKVTPQEFIRMFKYLANFGLFLFEKEEPKLLSEYQKILQEATARYQETRRQQSLSL